MLNLFCNKLPTRCRCPDKVFCIPTAISESAQYIVGLVYNGPHQAGYLYSGGIFTPVSYSGSIDTAVFGVNDAGQVVGDYTASTDGSNIATVFHAFLYSGGVFTDLGSIWASGINDLGEIVGTTTLPFVYSGGTYTTLNGFSPYYVSPTGINDSGQIVGSLQFESPLPAALPLFATGLGAFGLLGWRRKRKATALAA